MDLKCLRCGYEWVSRISHPKCCPECKSRKWDNDDNLTVRTGDVEDHEY